MIGGAWLLVGSVCCRCDILVSIAVHATCELVPGSDVVVTLVQLAQMSTLTLKRNSSLP